MQDERTNDVTPMPCPCPFCAAVMEERDQLGRLLFEMTHRAPDPALAAMRTALEGVSIMLATELRSYRDEPWAKRVISVLAAPAAAADDARYAREV